MFIVATALALAAAQASGAPAAAPDSSPQALFDAATAAGAAGKCAEAVEIFNRLAAMPSLQKNATASAMMKLRRGACQIRLGLDAESDLRSGLAVLEEKPEFRSDVAAAHVALGKGAYRNYDYAAAKAEFLAALGKLDPADRFEVLLWLVRVTMFDPSDEALGYADQAVALATAGGLPDNKHLLGDLHTLHARVLLNHGAVAQGYAELKQALKEQGGLSLKVDLGDVVTRSDLALAALLAHDMDSARQYMAYTGAGRLTSPFASAASMDLPPCGGADGLQPDDVAVVEFGINDNGSVSYATPIYASRNGPVALAFARAIADWSWTPKDAMQVPPFFRATTRVEVRCTTGSERPSVTQLLRHDVDAWFAREKLEPFATDKFSDAQLVAPAQAELARRRAAGGGTALLPVLIALGDDPVVPKIQRIEALREAEQLLIAAGAPAPVRVYVGFWNLPPEKSADFDSYRSRMRTILSRPEIAADPRGAAALKIMISEAAYHSPAPADAATLLQEIAADPRLDRGDPLRAGALVRLAAIEARSGDLAAARASYEQTGLSEQQCSLVDARPVRKNNGATDADFPMEALRWGFEGWVRAEFDIEANGSTARQRAVIAYPPFVFRDAAVKIARSVRYDQTYRPAGDPGCGGAQESIVFNIPH